MIEHIVLAKFSEKTTQEQKDNAITKLRDLKNSIPGIIDLKCGYDFSKRAQGFELGLTVRFESVDALHVYTPHPVHQEAVSYLKEIGLVDSIVFDFEI